MNQQSTMERAVTATTKDAAITQQALARIREYFPSPTVSCECREGLALLRGRVTSFYEKQMAQEAVRTVDGVQQVVSEIVVVPMTIRHDLF